MVPEEKLVRDHIPRLIRENGDIPQVRIASRDEMDRLLREKILEEAKELLQSAANEEIADILEAIESLLKIRGISLIQIRDIQEKKRVERGGFDKRYVLSVSKED